MAEPENHTLILLREMREEFRREFAKVREESNVRFDEIEKRLDGILNGTKAPKGLIGHRVMVERTTASFDDHVSRLEKRVRALEDARP